MERLSARSRYHQKSGDRPFQVPAAVTYFKSYEGAAMVSHQDASVSYESRRAFYARGPATARVDSGEKRKPSGK
jgi:hypothetical protein